MEKELTLFGKKASNLIGALGEIIAADSLAEMGIWTYKIGIWGFFPEGYPNFRDRRLAFLTKKQAEFVEKKEQNQIIEFDFVGVKLRHCKRPPRLARGVTFSERAIEGVYLVEVKTGRGANIRRYLKNPMKAFALENIKKAKRIGFRVLLVIVELLDNWKYRTTYKEL